MALSPTLKTTVLFDDDSIWEEAGRLMKEAGLPGSKVGPLENVALTVKMFAAPERFVTRKALELWEQLELSRALRLPLAPSIDDCPVSLADGALAVHRARINARAWLKKQNQGAEQ